MLKMQLNWKTSLTDLLEDEGLYEEACKISGDYVKQNAGATSIILQYIQENRLLTN